MAFIVSRPFIHIAVWTMSYVGSVEQLENCTLEMGMRKIVAVLARWLSLKVTGVTMVIVCMLHFCVYPPSFL